MTALQERFRRMTLDAEAKGLAEPFKGVMTDEATLEPASGRQLQGDVGCPAHRGIRPGESLLEPKGLKLSEVIMKLNYTGHD